MFMPSKGPSLERPDADAEKAEDAQFLNDFPAFTKRLGDVRALSAFRREFKLNRYHDMNIFVLAGRDERDVSADQVFASDDENNVMFYSTLRGVTNALKSRSHDAEKKNLSKQSAGERADVFIMLDPDVRVSKTLLGQVEQGGWVLCRLSTASTLRARGRYTFRALIEKNGENASISRRDDPMFWKSVEVDSEESFREASTLKSEGVVSYAEAAQKVDDAKEAGVKGMTDDVFESYSKLIKMAEKQNPGLVAGGETVLPLSVTIKDTVFDLGEIDTALPMKKQDSDENKIVVMRKNLA